MSRAPRDAINVPDAGIGDNRNDNQYPPQSVPNQASQGVPKFIDGSGPIFSMYLGMAEEEDKKMTESWKADADGILIFTGLFSAAVASLISVSIQDIRPNPQDTTNFYLQNIYQATIADPNRPNTSLSSTPPTFSPPSYAIWVNALWFMSLVISLTCALLATLLQQWARRYLKATQPRCSLHKRAKIRAFFFEGVEKHLLPWVVDALPTLLHVSLYLFFAGLVVLLWNVDLTIFKLVLSWVSICTALYGCITFIPIFRHDSPYYTPLTSLVWPIVVGIPYAVFRILEWFAWTVYFHVPSIGRFRDLNHGYYKMLSQGLLKTAAETALGSPSEIVARAFIWTFDCLDEDYELERFFSSLPDFRTSKVVDDPLPKLLKKQQWQLADGMIALLDTTFSSDILPQSVKNRRAIVCAKAIDPANIVPAFNVLDTLLSKYEYRGPLPAEFMQIARGWNNNNSKNSGLIAQATAGYILLTGQQRNDDPWFVLASSELGVPETLLRDYAAHGDSLSLAILIHLACQQFSLIREYYWPAYAFSNALERAFKFNAQDTSPELRHKFCALWNQIILKLENNFDQFMVFLILGPIRNIFLALHQGADSVRTPFSLSTASNDVILRELSTYPLCNIPGHHPDSTCSTPHIRNVSVSTALARTVPHDPDNTALVPSLLTTSPDPSSPFSSTHAPLRVDESLTDAPPLDDNISVPVSLQPVHPVIIRATHGSNDTSTRTMGFPISDPSGSSSPHKSKASASPPDSVSVPQTADRRAPLDDPDIPSSPSPALVLDSLLPSGPPLSSHSPVTGPDHTSSPELISVPTVDPSRPRPSSLGVAAEGECNATVVLRKEMDPHEPPSAIRQNTMTAPDRPPQSLSQSSVTDVAIPGPLWSSPDVEHTGDHAPHSSHSQYDIV